MQTLLQKTMMMNATSQEIYEIISRKEAKERGLKFFFTGKPCKRGGFAQRKIGNGDCICDACKTALAEIKRASAHRINPPKGRFIHPDEDSRRAAKNESNKRWQRKNPGKTKGYSLSWAKKNPEAHKAGAARRNKKWADKNRERLSEAGRRWRKEKSHIVNAHTANRRARRLKATPPWFGEFDEFVILEAADLVQRRKISTGIEWHVDHSIPLQAKKACGLHCAHNIQVIPGSMNISKSNKMQLIEAGEWLRHL